MNKIKLYVFLFVTCLFSSTLFAFEYDKPIVASVYVTNQNKKIISDVQLAEKKYVYLMRPRLTLEEKQKIFNYHPNHLNTISLSLPSKILLDISKMPVLDQGQHGTCVTFANTTALNILLGKGDYISQLCQLSLSHYISQYGAISNLVPPTGWDGSTSYYVLHQLMSFGFISKDKQKSVLCGGLVDYPKDSPNEIGKPMSLQEFHHFSENASDIMWLSLLDPYSRLGLNPFSPYSYDGDKILFQVKQFLANVAQKSKNNPNGIVTFGSFIPILQDKPCAAGACAKFHVLNDTWAVTSAIRDIDPVKDWVNLAGHAMIIIGYDDNATAIDYENQIHHGLFILRNSWGNDTGDFGNYYMTYDYFKQFVAETQLLYIIDAQSKG